jgi:predicted unusual protein kinase regulating ubiquinone biosynthesis (AarF/ABC1/UbiB family)
LIDRFLRQAIKDAGIDVNGFLTVGVSAALRQLLEFGLFHGDPHPGNIFAMRDGRIAYVDFGNVAVLSQVYCSIFVHTCMSIMNNISNKEEWIYSDYNTRVLLACSLILFVENQVRNYDFRIS